MVRRLKELVVDKDGCFIERSGKRVDVIPIGYPMGIVIPPDFDKRKTAAYLKNFFCLYQPQCQSLPGVPLKEDVDSDEVTRTIGYYLVNLAGQVSGGANIPTRVNTRKVIRFDTLGRTLTQFEKQETLHRLGAIQFYRER